MLDIASHPLLDIAAFTAEFPRPLGEVDSSAELLALFAPDAGAPMASSDAVREAVRKLLRHGGFRPTGRSKPAAEYLIKAVAEGILRPINLAVDACNVVSLHSGLPISVVDVDKVAAPLSVRIADANAKYVFNASGQEIDLGGLLCLCDAAGPCANAVKDAQRTKIDGATRRTLAIIWGTNALPGRAGEAARWYREILERHGVVTRDSHV
jgi:DNA/RNA-binding domain of Phe-tRNA-synthetase-like protein